MVGPKPVSAVGRIQVGDTEATAESIEFNEAFRRHYATVVGVLYSITGSREEAEDLAQEVFLRLHERRGDLGANPNVGGWLYRVATNAGFNAVRSRQRLHHRLLRWARLERSLPGISLGVDAEVESRQDAELVHRALEGLRERDRNVLILRYSGVSYAEIAAAVGVKPGSVGTILVRAERALRERYEQLNPAR